MSKLLVYFECESDQFGHIIGAIGSQMVSVQNLRVETNDSKTPPPLVLKRNSPVKDCNRHADKDWKRSRVQTIVMEALIQFPDGLNYEYLKDLMEENHFSRHSLSPAFTVLRKQGLVETSNGIAKLIKTEVSE